MAVAKVEGKSRKSAAVENGTEAAGGEQAMPQDEANRLSELGEKIFLDRYALKDVAKETLSAGDTVVVCVDLKSGQREIGTVKGIVEQTVSVELRDGTLVERAIEHVDKPIELRPSQMLDRVARGVAAAEPENLREEWATKFRWLLDEWKFVPAGRILTAAGSDQQLTWYNCYVIPSPTDSRAGIVQTLSNMMEVMSRGGGVGINLSSLRPRHSYVRGVNGRSSGAVSWGALYSFVTGLIEQGGSRRGALMLITNIWHPDVLEFISSKREMGRITNANISVGITDDFMKAVEEDADWSFVFPDTGDPDYNTLWDGNLDAWKAHGKKVLVHKTVPARDVWNTIIESAWASAEPGVFFVDRYNKMSNSWYFAPILCTNPCVTGDTLIYTAQGLVRAKDLFSEERSIDAVLDGRFGHEQSTSPASHVFRTGRKPVFRLQTREGYFVRATADHRIMTPRGWVELKDLQPGDSVHILNRKGGFGEGGSLELGRTLGWLIGDGTLKSNEAVLSFFGAEKRELAPVFAGHVNSLVEPLTATVRRYEIASHFIEERDEARIGSTRLYAIAQEHGLTETKHRVPDTVFAGCEAMQKGFLQALFTADGCFLDGGPKGGSIRLASNHIELLEGMQRLLLNFGVASRIYRNRREGAYRELPDGHGGLQSYWCEAQHELAISKQNLVTFAEAIGFLMGYKQEKLESYIRRGPRGPYSESFTATVEAITEEGIEDVYDLTEPLTHSFIGNGLVLHNCGEQGLPAWGVCNLGAINLARFVKDGDVDWENLGTAVRYSVRFLDDVIDATPYFFDENKKQQKSERRVGLNTMGLAEMLIRLKIRYGSQESLKFIDKLYEFIASEAFLASSELAKEKGAFPRFEAEKFLQSGFMQQMPEPVRAAIRENGCRNVTLLTQAPNGTIGTMVGTSTGIEPFYFWTYYRKSRLGMHEERVGVLEEWHREHPDTEPPSYFVNAMELTPEEHVGVQAAIQRWIDSSISKTCNVPNSYTVEQTRELYELMYRLGCKGGTIYRDGSRDEQVLSVKKEEPEPAAQPAARPLTQMEKVRPRPDVCRGVTVKKATPVGTAFVTMNDDEDGQPFEVFVETGKTGSDIKAMAEAMGRLMSLVLRLASPLTPKEKVQQIVNQVRGIGGARSLGFGKDRVRSLPDAVAQALEEQYGVHANGNGNGHYTAPSDPPAKSNGNGHLVPTDLCPSCGVASFVHEEGCMTCHSCGYSEC